MVGFNKYTLAVKTSATSSCVNNEISHPLKQEVDTVEAATLPNHLPKNFAISINHQTEFQNACPSLKIS